MVTVKVELDFGKNVDALGESFWNSAKLVDILLLADSSALSRQSIFPYVGRREGM